MGDEDEEDEEDVEVNFGEESDDTKVSDADVDVQIKEGMDEEDDAGPTAELGDEAVGEGSDDEGLWKVAIALLHERMLIISSLLGCRGRGSRRYKGAWRPRRHRC